MKYRDKPRETNLSFIFPFVLYTRSHIARTDGNDWKSLWYVPVTRISIPCMVSEVERKKKQR